MEAYEVDYDCVIIGASISGAVATYLLGNAGLRVLTIDSTPFPRRKPCGEGLSSLGVACLTRLGLWDSELEKHAVPLYGFFLTFLGGRTANIVSSKPRIHGISRSVLDSFIQKKSSLNPNITFSNENVIQLDYHEMTSSKVESAGKIGNWTIHLERPTTPLVAGGKMRGDNTILALGPRIVHSPIVVLATGLSGAISLLKPLTEIQEHTGGRFGLAFWAKGSWEKRPKAVQIFNRHEGQYIITPIGKNEVNLSLLLNKSRSQHFDKRRAVSFMLSFLEKQGFHIEEYSEVLGVPEIDSIRPNYSSRIPPQLFLTGDAIERFDPVGGLGMTHAIYSAALAAKEIVLSKMSGRAPSTKRYMLKRGIIATFFRILTRLSFVLNVRQAPPLVRLVSTLPLTATLISKLLEIVFSLFAPSLISLPKNGEDPKFSLLSRVSVVTVLWKNLK